MVLGTEQGAYQQGQRKEVKQAIARATSRQTGNSVVVCRLREGLLEGVRSPLKGRGKGVHLRQEAGMWDGL